MGHYIAVEVIKLMIRKELKVFGARVLLLGVTFKENCPDIRNSRAVDVAKGLREFGCEVDVYDPWADVEEVRREYGFEAANAPEQLAGRTYDAVVLAVAHRAVQGTGPRSPAQAGGGGLRY